jgi:hypothetical protein
LPLKNHCCREEFRRWKINLNDDVFFILIW